MSAKRAREKTDAIQPLPSASDADPLGDSTIDVLSRARKGDKSAVRVLIDRSLPPLRQWTHGRIPSGGRGVADTEDILQNAVLRTLERIGTFEHRSVSALQKYLQVAVVNGIRDIARRVRRRGVPVEFTDVLPDDAPSPEEEAILRQRSEKFVDALTRLRPADRQAVIWRVELGYSYQEIAQRLGKSIETARVTVNRALKRLKKEMGIEPRVGGKTLP